MINLGLHELILMFTLAVPAQAPPTDQQSLLESWFAKAGTVGSGESFGALVARIASMQLGKPYAKTNPEDDLPPESLHIELRAFECVSLVETTLALSRCLWLSQKTNTCFQEQLTRLRYRHGRLTDYTSRLHYFNDWISDNDQRQLVKELTRPLGGQVLPFAFSYMTRNRKLYPALQNPDTFTKIKAMEQEITQRATWYIPRELVLSVQEHLEPGDIVGIVTSVKRGLFIAHTGFVWKTKTPPVTTPNQEISTHPAKPQFLHASSHFGRVVLTPVDLSTYVHQVNTRRGIVLARPLEPNP